MKFIILVLTCMVVVAKAASTESPANGGPTRTTEVPVLGSEQQRAAAKAVWDQLSPAQKQCAKEKYEKDSDAIKASAKICHEKKGGLACLKDIPQLKPCFA